MARTSSIDIIDILESSNQELSAMIIDPESPLCVKFSELVNTLCERHADTSETVEVSDYHYNPLTHHIALIETKVRGHKIGSYYAILPDTKKLAVRLEVSALRFGYVQISPIELLMSVKRSNLVASYDMLRQLITMLENSL